MHLDKGRESIDRRPQKPLLGMGRLGRGGTGCISCPRELERSPLCKWCLSWTSADNQEVAEQMKQEQHWKQREQCIQSLMCLEKYGQEERCWAQLCFPGGLASSISSCGSLPGNAEQGLLMQPSDLSTQSYRERDMLGPSPYPVRRVEVIRDALTPPGM